MTEKKNMHVSMQIFCLVPTFPPLHCHGKRSIIPVVKSNPDSLELVGGSSKTRVITYQVVYKYL